MAKRKPQTENSEGGEIALEPAMAELAQIVSRLESGQETLDESLAQFERDLIRERTHAGLQAAEERDRRGGRQAVVAPEKLVKARQHLASGLNVREAAARVKIGKTALYEALKAEKSAASTVKPA